MSSTLDERMKKDLFPQMPDSFGRIIDDTLTQIGEQEGRRTARKRPRFLPMRIAAAAVALMIFASGCTFAIRPALAADIPVVNKIVYAWSPESQASEQVCTNIADTVSAVLNSFASGGAAGIGERFKSGDDWILNEDTFMAAYYLQYLAIREEIVTDGVIATYQNVSITNVSAEKKAFRYTADVSFDMVLKGDVRKSETAQVCLEENASGFRVVSIEMLSDGFSAYQTLISKYDSPAYNGGNLDDNISTYNAYIMFRERQLAEVEQHNQQSGQSGLSVGDAEKIGSLERLIREVRAADMPEAEKQKRIRQLEEEIQAIKELATPQSASMEDLAAELRYRYYTARKTGSVPELSDIVERNDDTYLLFYDLQLMVDKMHLGYFTPLVTVEKGYGEILDVLYDDGETVKLSMYVKTVIDGGVGEEMVLTFRKKEDGYLIVGYDRTVGDGAYRIRLKPLYEQYIREGLSPGEASRKAYEELLAEAKQTAEEHPEYLANRP